MTTWPRMAAGWLCEIALSVSSAMHSTKPLPRVLRDVRKARTSLPPGTLSWKAASMARSLMSDPPGGSRKLRRESRCPARSSVTWLPAARHRGLVALRARLGVVDRAEAVVEPLPFLEDGPIRIELRLGHESVRQVVEARGSFGRLRERVGQPEKDGRAREEGVPCDSHGGLPLKTRREGRTPQAARISRRQRRLRALDCWEEGTPSRRSLAVSGLTFEPASQSDGLSKKGEGGGVEPHRPEGQVRRP